MRRKLIGVLCILLLAGCGEKEGFSHASDFEGNYYYVTKQASCDLLSIRSDGSVSGFCGGGSMLECTEARSCNLMCLNYAGDDTTALLSIKDMRPAAEAVETWQGKPIPDHLYVSPYVPPWLSGEEKFNRAFDTVGLRVNLYFNRFDCEYTLKSMADEESVE